MNLFYYNQSNQHSFIPPICQLPAVTVTILNELSNSIFPQTKYHKKKLYPVFSTHFNLLFICAMISESPCIRILNHAKKTKAHELAKEANEMGVRGSTGDPGATAQSGDQTHARIGDHACVRRGFVTATTSHHARRRPRLVTLRALCMFPG